MDKDIISDNHMNGGFNQVQVLNEIKQAKKEERPVDFSNKTVADFSLLTDKIRYGLNLENAIILSPLFLGKIVIEGDVNLKRAKINGSLFLGRAEIKGDLILEDAEISGTVNLIGAKIHKSVKANGLKNAGFLNLSNSEIGGDIELENAQIKDMEYKGMIMRGDLFLDAAIIKGSLNLSKITVGGLINLDGTSINKDLIITQTKVKHKIDTTTAFIMGRKII